MESLDRTRLDPGQPPGSRPGTEPPQDLRRLGEYRILRRLGEGGMGAVYLGYHEAESKQFALKVLNDQLACNQAYIDRFYREARSGVLLSHPNLVRCFGAGQDATTGKHYLILEYVDGPSTLAILEQHGKLSVGDAVHIALDVARALEHAHSRNIIHRDIKPDNILITRSGVSKLADLGLAKRTDEASHLTAARQGFGTSYYMPYEQAVNARQADGRSDIYALGATLYHLLTGEVPFRGETHLDVVEKKDLGAFTAAVERNPAVPPVLDQILAKMLARQPRDRYQTASEAIIDLERSRLAAPVPSYADPDLALQDPWVRACLASSAQPTQPDLAVADRVETPLSPAEDDEPSGEWLWIIRFKPHDGRWRRVRMSESQLRQRLQEGRVPADAEICSDPRQGFHPLSADPLFGPLLAEHAARTPPRRGRNPSRPETPRAEGPLPRPSWPLIVAVGLTSLLVGGLGLLAFLLLKNP